MKFYHGTSEKIAKNIIEKGFKIQEPDPEMAELGQGLYLTSIYWLAVDFAHSVVLEIDLPEMDFEIDPKVSQPIYVRRVDEMSKLYDMEDEKGMLGGYAKRMRENALKNGIKIGYNYPDFIVPFDPYEARTASPNIQVVIYDQDFLDMLLKENRIKLIEKPLGSIEKGQVLASMVAFAKQGRYKLFNFNSIKEIDEVVSDVNSQSKNVDFSDLVKMNTDDMRALLENAERGSLIDSYISLIALIKHFMRNYMGSKIGLMANTKYGNFVFVKSEGGRYISNLAEAKATEPYPIQIIEKPYRFTSLDAESFDVKLDNMKEAVDGQDYDVHQQVSNENGKEIINYTLEPMTSIHVYFYKKKQQVKHLHFDEIKGNWYIIFKDNAEYMLFMIEASRLANMHDSKNTEIRNFIDKYFQEKYGDSDRVGVIYISRLRKHFTDTQIIDYIRSLQEHENSPYDISQPSHVQEEDIQWLKENVNSLLNPNRDPEDRGRTPWSKVQTLWYYLYKMRR